MLKLFQSYSPFSVIALLLATLVLKLFWIIHPEGVLVLEHQNAWALIVEGLQFILGKSNITMTFFAVVNLAGQALFFNRIANDADLFSMKNYLPALSYILFTSLLPEWNYLSASLISNWFLLFSLNGMLKLQSHASPRKIIFNIGFAIACAGMLSLPYLFLLFLLFVALSILRPFKFGEWVIGVLGFLTPFYFLICILFLTDRLPEILNWVPHNIELISHFATDGLKPFICLGFALLMLVLGLFYLNANSEHMLIQVKKRWSIMIAGLIIGLTPLFFKEVGGQSLALPSLAFLSLIAANALIKRKKQWTGRILFYLFLAVLIFAEWIQLP